MRRALALSIPLLLLSACTYDDGDARRYALDPQPGDVTCGGTAQSSKIDTGATLEIDAGSGAGVYVEYAKGGHWHIRTSCDTNCPWDILVTPETGHSFSNVKGEDLEPNDTLAPHDSSPGTYQLLANTSSDIDGFTFDADPGAALTLDVLLDGSCTDAVHFVYWNGDGALHTGAPTNPLGLVPSSD